MLTAASIIFIHSHPSGDPDPSREDKKITKALKKAGDLMDIKILDHVIIGSDKFYSFADSGELDEY